jgi:hypothetical protein
MFFALSRKRFYISIKFFIHHFVLPNFPLHKHLDHLCQIEDVQTDIHRLHIYSNVNMKMIEFEDVSTKEADILIHYSF